MTGLVEFLTARLDEDEQVARAVAGWGTGVWETRPHSGPPVSVWSAGERPAVLQVSGTWVEPGAHIARHDPARVLAEVAAKRAILAEHEPRQEDPFAVAVVEDGIEWGVTLLCTGCVGRKPVWPCVTVRALAAPYADHPNFDESWRVAAIVRDRETT